MMPDHSRRSFLKVALLGAAGAAISRSAHAGRASALPPSTAETVRLGVASYSLRRLSRTDAIAAIQALRTPYVNIKSFHLPYDSTPEALATGRREFEAAGLQIVGGGTITLEKDQDEDIRKYFEYAKRSGMPLMVIAPIPEALPRIERFVRQYDIKVAIHNHGPEDPYFPAPRDAIALIKEMDPRVGVCVDVGHTARTGIDVVEALSEAGDRLLDMHLKDLRDLRVRDSQCIVGHGAMPIAAIFRELQRLRYGGYVNLEYEIDPDDPLPGMKESFAYARGVLAGMHL